MTTGTPDEWDRSYDVVVIGGGGAGIAASLSAVERDEDLDVLLVQKDEDIGGVTGISMGSFTAAETYLQEEKGIEDSTAFHFQDLDKFVGSVAGGPDRRQYVEYSGNLRGRDDLELRETWVEHAPETLAWLHELGCVYVGPYGDGHHRIPRMHVIENDYVDVLGGALSDSRVDVSPDSRAKRLVRSGDGVVSGVEVRTGDSEVSIAATTGLVLATGSYAASSSLRAQYTADCSAPAIYESNTGGGHEMAADAGAALVNMDIVSLSLRCEPPLYTGPDVPSLVDAGAILVSENGQRFVNEVSTLDQLFSSVLEQPGRRMYVLFDEGIASRFESWPNYISTFKGKPWGYVSDYLRTDFLVREDRIEDLGHRIDADTATLRRTVDLYSYGVPYEGAGYRDEYGRTTHRTSLRTPPWYLLGPIRAYCTVTHGGVAVDTSFRVLDEDGDVIPGLYAAGSVAGGVHRFGHGHPHSWTFTSGRLAGQNVST